MPNTLSTAQILQMRKLYDDTLPDLCDIMSRTDAASVSGQPVGSYAASYSDVPCGFENSPFKFRSREIVAGGEGTSEILVRARLPMKYYDYINQDDRLRLTKRFGDTYATPETYEIQGFAERGPAGIILNLKRVEP